MRKEILALFAVGVLCMAGWYAGCVQYCQLKREAAEDRLIIEGRHPSQMASPRSPQWPAVRKHHLAIFPTCEACGGSECLQVHHCLPYHLKPSLELDPDNLITLCAQPGHDCHLFIGHLGDYAAYNPDVRKDAAMWLKKRNNRPYK